MEAVAETKAMIDFENWGLIDYREALDKQNQLVEKVAAGEPETIVFCRHRPVVTLGRGTRDGDVCGWSGDIVEINRGGRATYHGPSQLVVYPILSLDQRGRDLHKHMRTLEDVTIKTLRAFGIPASGRSFQLHDGDTVAIEATGVWVENRKIASIGIGVRKWVSFHGLAINLSADPTAFVGLKPCGFKPSQMITAEEALGDAIDRARFEATLRRELLIGFQTTEQ